MINNTIHNSCLGNAFQNVTSTFATGKCQTNSRHFLEITIGWTTKKLQVFAGQFNRWSKRYFHPFPIFPRLQGSTQLKCNFQILIHPQYSVGGNLHYDVCLLKLDKPISFPDHPNVRNLVFFLPKSQKFLSEPGLIIGLSL